MKFNTLSKKILFIFFILFIALKTNAQQNENGNLSGIIVDESGIPLPGGEIYVKIDNLYFGDISDFDGKFIISKIPAGNQNLHIKYLGYKEKTIPITVIKTITTTYLGKIELQPDVERTEEIVVIARSKGQVRSLNIQKSADNIVNVISLEQASKFPDSNIGDALKRVTGITIQTDQGEARNVSVRGLGSESTTVLVNGDRISATSFNSRSVEVDLIPADVIQNIEVTKSASADLDGEATGGVINLITRAAYSSDLKLNLRVNYGLTPTWDKINYNTAIGISKKFFNERLGFAFNGSSDSRSFQSNNIEIDWDFEDTGELDNPTDDTRFLNEFEIRRYWLRRDRRNLNLGLDYEFSKNSLIGLKSSLSFRDDFENRYRTRYTSIDFPQEYTPDGIAISEGLVRTDTRGGSSEGKPNNYRLDRKNVFNNKLYGKHIIGSVEADWSLSYALAKKRRAVRSIDYRISEGESNLFIDTRNPNRPRITSDIQNFNESAVLGNISETFQNLDDDALKGSLTFKVPFKNGYFKTGARYRKNKHSEDNRSFAIEPIIGNIIDSFKDIPKENYHTSSNQLNSYKGFDTPSREFIGNLDINNPLLFNKTESLSYNYNYSYNVLESRSAAYIQGKYEFFENFSVRGGFRWELTKGDYNAFIYNEVENVIIPNNTTIEYDNLLPSVDFKYKIKPFLIARLAYAKTLSRPTYSRLLPRVRFTGGDEDDITDNTVLRLGNPNLKPRISNNFDFSLELYLRKAGLLSIGLFHKQLNNFIGSVSSFETLIDGRVLDIRQYQNLGTGKITGVELTFQRGLDFLPWHFKNLNIYSNVTLLDSELSNFTTSLSNTGGNTNFRRNEKRNLADTSNFTYNIALSYKSKRAEVTASFNSTSEFIDSYGIVAIQDEYEDKKSFLDINASYSINSKVNIFVEAKNLTNQPLREYVGQRQILQMEEYYGAQYVFGFNYKF